MTILISDENRVRTLTLDRPEVLNAFDEALYLNEMQARISDPSFADKGSHFTSMIDALTDFPKPLICAVNGLGVGIGTTILGYADLVFMSSQARLKCPFTSLGVAPEAASSYLMPQLIGRRTRRGC